VVGLTERPPRVSKGRQGLPVKIECIQELRRPAHDRQHHQPFLRPADSHHLVAGVRALANMPKPGNMKDLTWQLIDDGWAVWLRTPTPFGGCSCVAEFSTQMTEKEMVQGDWFRSDMLMHRPAAGNP
jgi:hypothetical protein